MSASDHQLRFENRGKYLYAHLSGHDGFEASLNYWHAIADEAKATGHDRVLVHENLAGDVSEDEMFEIMLSLISKGIGIKVAFFDENHESAELNALGELVATNRGLNVQIFDSLSAAEEWLLDDERR